MKMYKKGSVVLYMILLGLTILLAVQLGTFSDTSIFPKDNTSQETVFVEEVMQDTPSETKHRENDNDIAGNNATQENNETTVSTQDTTITDIEQDNLQSTDSEPKESDVSQVISVVPAAVTPEPLIIPEKYVTHDKNALEAEKVFYYTNVQRDNFNLQSLVSNNVLNQAATAKINDMFDKQYFEHVAPDGKDVMYWADEVGYAYILVGENLAMGNFKDEEAMVIAWMESPGHRENILKTSYTELGVAVGKGNYLGNEVWMGVQIFGTPLSACPSIDHDLYTNIEVKQAVIDSLELQIAVQYPEVANLPQPKTQEEYDYYMSLVDAYNSLVEQHREAVSVISEMIEIYNGQVQSYNTCIATI